MNEQAYMGGELGLFARARHWKGYWSRAISPFVQGDVLEVGAGLGANTGLLRARGGERWVCLEPDPLLLKALQDRLPEISAGRPIECQVGTLSDMGPGDQFDTILYIDVLEHIEQDRRELELAAGHLRKNGHLIVLSPAHNWLFSPFDAAIGHHRRYTRAGLRELTPPSLELARSFYLDSIGLLASAANRVLLRQSMPTERQLAVWDGFMVPCSRVVDTLTAGALGKSVVSVWRRR